MDTTPSSVSTFRVGDRVRQELFGNGTVLNVELYHITIDFDIRGERTFLKSSVQLSPETAPTDREIRAAHPRS
jgi:hypothetical protein